MRIQYINVWFPFMHSQKRNCAASLFPKQNYYILSPNSYTRISVRHLYISSISLSILLLGNMWTDPWNILIAHRHMNVEIATAMPRKGIHNFRCSAFPVQGSPMLFYLLRGLIFYRGRRAVAVSLREPGAGTFLPLAASSRSGERYSERDSERERAKERE
jgi:hypothetical protein